MSRLKVDSQDTWQDCEDLVARLFAWLTGIYLVWCTEWPDDDEE